MCVFVYVGGVCVHVYICGECPFVVCVLPVGAESHVLSGGQTEDLIVFENLVLV